MTAHTWSRTASADSSSQLPRLLVVTDYRPYDAAAIIDHIDSLRRFSRYDVFVLPTFGDLPDELDLDQFDAVVVHFSVVMRDDNYLTPLARWRLRRARGVVAAFVQDEYRFVDDTIDVLRAIGAEVLFTCVPEDQVPLVYSSDRLPALRRTVTVLTGYVTADLLDVPVASYDDRPVDVGYRARRNPFWLGSLGEEKSRIAERFARDAPAFGLRTDISVEEADRIYGDAWPQWLSSCKSVLGVESGASVFDFDGSVERAVNDYVARHPNAAFDEVHDAVLRDVDGRIRLNQISPRCFEAAALGTLMVLYEGDYSGVLKPWQHYVPLKKDHSNTDEVAAALRDRHRWERITRAARDEVAADPRWSWSAMAGLVDDGLDLGERTGADRPLDVARFESLAQRSYDALPHSRLNTGRLPRQVEQVRRTALAELATLRPDRSAVSRDADRAGERLRGVRSSVRRASSLLGWALRRGVPRRRLVGPGSRELLADLADLAAFEQAARHSTHTASGRTPYVVTADRDRAALTVRLADDPSAAGQLLGADDDLRWVQQVEVDITERFLAPTGVARRRTRRFDAVSALVAEQPDLLRRVVLPVAGPSVGGS